MTEYLPDHKREVSLSDLAYAEFEEALAEEQRLLRQIDDRLTNTTDRLAAERLVLDQYASRVDAALRRSRAALEKWIAAVRQEEAARDEHSASQGS